MKPLRSLRFRIVIGSLFWTAGIIFISHLLSFVFIDRDIHSIRFASANGTLIAVAAILMLAGLSGLRSGLSPFRRLRAQLAALRDGRERRVEGAYPTEVQPLVNDLNALLDHREQVVTRAVAKAGDLAHGLKTPLAVLAQEAARAEAAGQHDIAAAIDQQVERMRRQIDYHLAQARAVASGATPGARSSVSDSAEGLARTLRRLHADRGLTIDVHVPADLAVRGQREDLDEMLGNLLDNGCKWAKSHVAVSASRVPDAVVVMVDDDGPGLAPSMRAAVLQRGVRADEAAPGSGFGLAIVRDLAELYGGSIALEDSPLGGLRARLQLPAA
jgi:signal transduction histidine kinase